MPYCYDHECFVTIVNLFLGNEWYFQLRYGHWVMGINAFFKSMRHKFFGDVSWCWDTFTLVKVFLGVYLFDIVIRIFINFLIVLDVVIEFLKIIQWRRVFRSLISTWYEIFDFSRNPVSPSRITYDLINLILWLLFCPFLSNHNLFLIELSL